MTTASKPPRRRRTERSKRPTRPGPSAPATSARRGRGSRSARAVALDVLEGVLHRKRALDAVLATHREGLDAQEGAFAAELSYGVLRWLPQLEAVLAQRLDKPLRSRDRRVHYLLLLGLYQLLHARTPAYAAINETVSLAPAAWARGLANAVLKRVAADPEDALAQVRSRSGRSAHPDWLLDVFDRDWPNDSATLVAAGNTRPAMCLRVNARRGHRDAYLARLAKTGIEARAHVAAPQAIVLAAPCPVERLPGFDAGDVSVQDASAQLCAPLLDLAPGQRLLDACAAPGGKCAHALESEPGLERVTALDSSEERLERASATLARLGLTAELRTADASDTDAWFDGSAYDRVLLDAPCSGTGVIRRHPDIKALRRSGDLSRLAEQQHALLSGVWPALAPGGRLVYVTCSVLNCENDAVVERFAESRPDVRLRPVAPLLEGVEIDSARTTALGLQVLPRNDPDPMDGFYYAVMERG